MHEETISLGFIEVVHGNKKTHHRRFLEHERNSIFKMQDTPSMIPEVIKTTNLQLRLAPVNYIHNILFTFDKSIIKYQVEVKVVNKMWVAKQELNVSDNSSIS